MPATIPYNNVPVPCLSLDGSVPDNSNWAKLLRPSVVISDKLNIQRKCKHRYPIMWKLVPASTINLVIEVPCFLHGRLFSLAVLCSTYTLGIKIRKWQTTLFPDVTCCLPALWLTAKWAKSLFAASQFLSDWIVEFNGDICSYDTNYGGIISLSLQLNM